LINLIKIKATMPCLPMSAIPGLNEPKLHEINNYLFQLNKLWSGYNVIICEYILSEEW
jgi:hypothetical protein